MRAGGVSVRAVGSGHSAFGYHFFCFLRGLYEPSCIAFHMSV